MELQPCKASYKAPFITNHIRIHHSKHRTFSWLPRTTKTFRWLRVYFTWCDKSIYKRTSVAHYWCYPSKNLWRKTGIYKHTKKREKLSSLTVYKKCSFYIQRKMLPRARWWCCCHKFVFGSCNYWNFHGRAWEDDSTIMDIIVWQKVKNTEKTPLPLYQCWYNNSVVLKCLQLLFFCYNIDKGGRGDILGLF